MGEVWRAVHRRQRVPVAIKVVTAPAGQVERFRRLFTKELRAVARLEHPAIVRVFDHGEVPSGFAGPLPVGAPYLVMSWLDGGSLRSHPPVGWSAIRATLMALLDGLAHAHARGVVHRDLKVDNVLWGPEGPVLTDFGLAWQAEAGEWAGRERRLMGTPNYMAPEQIDGDLRALGPWTDLYALGCVAFALATGRPPFDQPSPLAVLKAHVTAPVPTMRTIEPLPAGFEAWTARLLSKRPAQRFAFAADAARALLAIEAGGARTAVAGEAPVAVSDPSASDLTLVAPPRFVSITDQSWTGTLPTDLPRVPPSWRGPERDDEPPVLLGTGRTIFGLRTVGLRGRDGERDRLWAALREAAEGELRVVALTGPAGQGKSRLARWLGERAAELGVAQPLRATHAQPPEPGCGVARMLARHLRCEGLDAAARLTRLDGWLADPAQAPALAALFDPTGRVEVDGRAVAIHAGDERLRTMAAALGRLSETRPLVWSIEDAEYADEARALLAHLRSTAPQTPMLVALTARDPDHPGLAALIADPTVEHIEVGPLRPAAQRRLIGSLLPLEPALVDALVERTGGSPIFAEQLIGHWLAIDALEQGPQGFRLAAGAHAEAPADLEAVWAARLDEVLHDHAARAALEVAAALGVQVDGREWAAACAAAGLAVPTTVVERMLDARLLSATASGWRFAHALLREALTRTARAAGRARAHAQACAAALSDPARRAEHLLAAGRLDAALDALTEAGAEALRRTDIAVARRALRRQVEILRGARRARGDRGWSRARLLAAQVANTEGRSRVAWRRARRAVVGADDAAVASRAQLALGRAACNIDRQAVGLAAFDAARTLAEQAGDGRAWAEATLHRGTALLAAGHTEAARADYMAVDARLAAEPAPDDALRGELMVKLCDVERRRGNADAAFVYATAARACFRRLGARWPSARLSNTLGDLHRHRGDFAAAMRCYEELRALSAEIGLPVGEDYAHANLGLTLIQLGRYVDARPLLTRALSGAEARGDVELRTYMHAAMWACDAAAGDWAAWDARRATVDPLVTGHMHDPDCAMVAEHAARLASAAGEWRRAGEALRLAAAQLRALDRAHEVPALRPAGMPAAMFDAICTWVARLDPAEGGLCAVDTRDTDALTPVSDRRDTADDLIMPRLDGT